MRCERRACTQRAVMKCREHGTHEVCGWHSMPCDAVGPGAVVLSLSPLDLEWLDEEVARQRSDVPGEERADRASVLRALVKRARRNT